MLPKTLARKYGLREFMVKRYIEIFGVKGTKEFLDKVEKGVSSYVRVNTIRGGEEEITYRLMEKGFDLKDTFVPHVYSIKGDFSPSSSLEYLRGEIFLQDLSSAYASFSLGVKEGERVLDMCSAPGAKTTHIAQLMRNKGEILAVDSSKTRVLSLIYNLARCGVRNCYVWIEDSRKLPSMIKSKFDRVLLDAPCTGEGVISKDRSRKLSRVEKDYSIMSSIQKELISSGLSLLKEGGILVYSTCSISPEENEEVISYALEKFQVEIIPLEFGERGLKSFMGRKYPREVTKCRRFYPHVHDTYGFFLAKLRLVKEVKT